MVMDKLFFVLFFDFFCGEGLVEYKFDFNADERDVVY